MGTHRSGRPTLRIVAHACPSLVAQLSDYEREVVDMNGQQVITDKPAKRQQIDVAVCLEYFAAAPYEYVAPPPRSLADRPLTASQRAAMAWLAKQQKERATGTVMLGAESALNNVA